MKKVGKGAKGITFRDRMSLRSMVSAYRISAEALGALIRARKQILAGAGCSIVCGGSPLRGSGSVFDCLLDHLEELPTVPGVLRRPELLEDLERMQDLRFRVL